MFKWIKSWFSRSRELSFEDVTDSPEVQEIFDDVLSKDIKEVAARYESDIEEVAERVAPDIARFTADMVMDDDPVMREIVAGTMNSKSGCISGYVDEDGNLHMDDE